MTKTENKKTVAAFQVWHNGTYQTSALYSASNQGQNKVDFFIKSHNESGTFAELKIFTSEAEAKKEFAYWNED